MRRPEYDTVVRSTSGKPELRRHAQDIGDVLRRKACQPMRSSERSSGN